MSDLVPIEQKEVVFFEGTTITAVLIDGDVYASINSMCDALELDRQAQRRRIERSDVLNDGQRVAKLATQLSQAVKNVAMSLSKKTKRNEYGGVFGELYRRYNVTSYKAVPVSKFDEAMAWLREWLHKLESDGF